MSFEFGCRHWLKQRPIVYLLSHMLIMPIVDFYATTIDWITAKDSPSTNLVPFLIASFFNGIVIEIGRKIRLPTEEENGVETYSFLWGYKRATIIWLTVMGITFFFGIFAIHKISQTRWVYIPMSLCYLFSIGYSYLHVFKTQDGKSKKFEMMAAVWTIVLYSSIGVLGNY
jgi:4-hydroxybenzoate polyprenyltransferase